MNDVVDSMLEVTLSDPQDFLKVKETLSRVGIASERNKTLYQSCHILHKRGKYYIVHFKELFLLDGKPATFSEQDKARRNKIAMLLQEWNLVTIKSDNLDEDPVANMGKIKIIPYREKSEWELVTKYEIGNKTDVA